MPTDQIEFFLNDHPFVVDATTIHMGQHIQVMETTRPGDAHIRRETVPNSTRYLYVRGPGYENHKVEKLTDHYDRLPVKWTKDGKSYESTFQPYRVITDADEYELALVWPPVRDKHKGVNPLRYVTIFLLFLMLALLAPALWGGTLTQWTILAAFCCAVAVLVTTHMAATK